MLIRYLLNMKSESDKLVFFLIAEYESDIKMNKLKKNGIDITDVKIKNYQFSPKLIYVYLQQLIHIFIISFKHVEENNKICFKTVSEKI